MTEGLDRAAVRGEVPRPVGGLGTTVAVLLGLAAAAAAVASVWLGWSGLAQVQRVASPASSSGSRYGGSGALDAAMDGFYASLWLVLAALALALVAGVTTIAWTVVARRNAERIPGERPRWAAAWSVLAWIVPLANVVLAPLVLIDLGRASGVPGRTARPVAVWIAAVVIGVVVHFVALPFAGLHIVDPTDTAATAAAVSDARTTAIFSTVQALLDLVAGVALAVTVRRISAAQDRAASEVRESVAAG